MNRLPLTLTLIGVTPFVILSVAVSMHVFADPKVIIQVLLTYAAVIVSFMGGIHWGIAVTRYGEKRHIANLLIFESIWPTIIAWGALFYIEIHIQLLVLTLLYTFLWAIESLLYSNNLIPQWFFNLRCIITPIVVVSLYVAYFGLI
jgi:uncharacterized membrane protein YhdT